MTRQSQIILARASQQLLAVASAKTLAITAIFFLLCFYGFSMASTEFAKVTEGHVPLDLQFPLTVNAIFDQLAVYTPASKIWYQIFVVLDFIFPPVASLLVVMFWGVIIKHYSSPLLLSLAMRGCLLLPMVSALLDYLENFGLLYVVHVYPDTEAYGVAELAVNLQLLKLTSLAMLAGLTLLILFIAMNHKYAWTRR